jgi:RNA polymerase subunit RPABC4/transcription elongation factor Spt4
MVKLKVNKDTGRLYELKVVQDKITKSRNFTEKFKGMIMVLNTEKSFGAKKLNIEEKGFFAINY